jgi:hypothetical protein
MMNKRRPAIEEPPNEPPKAIEPPPPPPPKDPELEAVSPGNGNLSYMDIIEYRIIKGSRAVL